MHLIDPHTLIKLCADREDELLGEIPVLIGILDIQKETTNLYKFHFFN
jgi:hypothetical protein